MDDGATPDGDGGTDPGGGASRVRGAGAGPERGGAGAPRRRDPGRTKAALLDAARVEFAAKGLAGARVGEIAQRAGVNKQLISYYFGGKDGLHRALTDEWHERERAMAEPGLPLEDLVVRYLEAGHEDPDMTRFWVRESVEEDPSGAAYDPDAHEVADLRARQAAGEIGDELDPAFLLLVLQSAVASGAVFPAEAKRVMGMDPRSREYADHVGEQLRRIVRRLA